MAFRLMQDTAGVDAGWATAGTSPGGRTSEVGVAIPPPNFVPRPWGALGTKVSGSEPQRGPAVPVTRYRTRTLALYMAGLYRTFAVLLPVNRFAAENPKVVYKN